MLKGIDLKAVEINIKCCPKNSIAAAKELMAIAKEQNAVETLRGSIDFNPMRRALKHGS